MRTLIVDPQKFSELSNQQLAAITHAYLARNLANFVSVQANTDLLSTSFARMRALTHLNISCNKLSENKLLQILRALNIKLKVLNLRGNQITNPDIFHNHAEIVIFPGSRTMPDDYTPAIAGWVFNEPMSLIELQEIFHLAPIIRADYLQQNPYAQVRKLNRFQYTTFPKLNNLRCSDSIDTNLPWSVIFAPNDTPVLLPKYKPQTLPLGIIAYNFPSYPEKKNFDTKDILKRITLAIGLDATGKNLTFSVLKRKIYINALEVQGDVAGCLYTSQSPTFGIKRPYSSYPVRRRLNSNTLVKTFFFSPHIDSEELYDIIDELFTKYSVQREQATDIVEFPSDIRQQQLIMLFACWLETLLCRAAGYVHRDIKPENIKYSMTKKVAKLLDYGFASSIFAEQPQPKSGTPGYVPPERLYSDSKYIPTVSDDDYAIGFVSCAILYPIFWCSSYALNISKMVSRDEHLKLHEGLLSHFNVGITKNYSVLLATLVNSLSNYNPTLRTGINSIFFTAANEFAEPAISAIQAKLIAMREKILQLTKTYPEIVDLLNKIPQRIFVIYKPLTATTAETLLQDVNRLLRQQTLVYYFEIFNITNGLPSLNALATLTDAIKALDAQPDKPIAQLNTLYFWHQKMEDLILELYNAGTEAKPYIIPLKPRRLSNG